MTKIISFDIWDTIIKRRCHPEEIKLHVANYIALKYEKEIKEKYKDIYEILKTRDNIEYEICQENKKSGKDDECKILDVFKRLQESKKVHYTESALQVSLKGLKGKNSEKNAGKFIKSLSMNHNHKKTTNEFYQIKTIIIFIYSHLIYQLL